MLVVVFGRDEYAQCNKETLSLSTALFLLRGLFSASVPMMDGCDDANTTEKVTIDCSFLIDILKQIYYLEKGLSTSLLTQFTIILT
jgi:hypothetical protein